MRLLVALIVSTLATAPYSALADGFKYHSDSCDFTLDLPEEVMIDRQCTKLEDEGDETCFEKLRYTKTVEAQTTIKIDLSCNELHNITYDNYNKDKMLFTAESFLISQEINLEQYDLRYVEHEKSKRVLIFGSGKNGLSDMIYFGHVWLGQNSLMSMNAYIIGSGNTLADNVFKNILVSLASKNDDPAIQTNQAASE